MRVARLSREVQRCTTVNVLYIDCQYGQARTLLAVGFGTTGPVCMWLARKIRVTDEELLDDFDVVALHGHVQGSLPLNILSTDVGQPL